MWNCDKQVASRYTNKNLFRKLFENLVINELKLHRFITIKDAALYFKYNYENYLNTHKLPKLLSYLNLLHVIYVGGALNK